MNKPVRRIRSFLLPSAIWAVAIIAAVIGIVFRSRWERLGNLSTDDVIVLAACMGLAMIMFAIIASFRLVIDERGATQHAGFNNRVHIPWNEVRSVTVARLFNGRRMIFISRVKEPVLQPKTQEEVRLNRQKTLGLEYSRKRLDCIRQYWQGDVRDLTRT
ncbi:MAG: hypothetical protein IJA77_11370 [Clostridia bacterium]|nr:hypothetical protein [Clostridia bacterium]